MKFSEVIGQSSVKEKLLGMMHHNRLSHALLFLEKEGSGGLALALAFAQFIVCEKNGINKSVVAQPASLGLFGEEPEIESAPAIDSCGVCAACVKAEKMIHPDIHFSFPIFPQKPGDKPNCNDFIQDFRSFVQKDIYGNVYDWLQFAGAENKQGNINVHEIENILHKISLKSFESEYKILIMWRAEFLGKEGNRLLKLIEEPPPNTLFIFVAENQDAILNTILSRTQLVTIPVLDTKSLQNALSSKTSYSPQQIQEAAIMSHGNYREAINYLQESDESWEQFLKDWLNSIVSKGPIAQVEWIEKIAKIGRESQKQFLKYFNHVLHESVRITAIGTETLYQDFSLDERADVQFALKIIRRCNVEQLAAIIEEVDKASYYIERNANVKLLFHALTIRIYNIMQNRVQIEVN